MELIKQLLNYKNGFFIEVGANDGIQQSNTLFFEQDLGWDGILIEPCKSSFERCRANRKCNYVVHSALVGDETVNSIRGDFNDGHLMSSIDGKRLHRDDTSEVPATTLNKILRSIHLNRTIDLFSLDVEGYEYEVLQGLDLNAYKVKCILIEIMLHNYEKVVKHLEQNNFVLIDNVTKFTKETHPGWDGTHNDYIFCLREFLLVNPV